MLFRSVSQSRYDPATQVYDGEGKGIHINLAGYVNRAFRLLELKPKDDELYVANTVIMNTGCFLPFIDGEVKFGLARLYERLKLELPELKNSTDALE